MAIYGDSLAVISYNSTFTPYTIDSARGVYYAVTPADHPTVVFDGTDRVFESNQNMYDTVFNQHIIAAKADTPLFNLTFSASSSVDSTYLQIKIVTADTIPDDLVSAFVVITEDSIHGMTKHFNYVCEQMQNFDVSLVYPDSLDTTIIFTPAIPSSRRHVVLFVQDMDSKKILCAAATDIEEIK